jgi:hypothetical protein
MRIQSIIPFVFGLCLLTLGNGCATKALWENSNLEAWKEPATNPNLRLFAAKQPNDILIVYDEYSERSDATHTRAYWLNQNQKLIDERHAPHFVDPNSAVGCTAIPVLFVSTNGMNLPTPPYALLATNRQSFTLHLSDATAESHDLPFYNDQKGKVEKVALTPLANAADLTIVGGVFGYIFLEALAQSGASYSWKP